MEISHEVDTLGIWKISDPFNNGDMLKGIFWYQKCLMRKLVALGYLPKMEMTLSEPADQACIRKYIDYTIEELVEAFEEIDALTTMFSQQKGWPTQTNETEITMIKLAEEFADVLHFMVEVMIFTNMDHEDVVSYQKFITKEPGIEVLASGDGLNNALALSEHIITFSEINIVRLQALRITTDGCLYLPLQHVPNTQYANQVSLLMFGVIRKLKKAANQLKSKEWKPKASEASSTIVQTCIMEAFHELMKLYKFCGWDAKSIYFHYERKNRINQKRLKENGDNKGA